MRLTDIPIDRPVATIMLLVGLVVLGAVSVGRIPLDFWPLLEEPEVEVVAPLPGSHPLESLRDVALPIEEEIATIPEVKSIYTQARSGSVFIQADFDASTNVDLKKMEVREAVERARDRLPAQVGFIRVAGDVEGIAGGAVLHGRISAVRDLSESWDLLDRRIKRPLERIKGVARVDLYGVRPQEVRVDLDLASLRKHGVQPVEVMTVLDESNLDLDLGAVRGDVLRYNVRSLGRFRDLDAIRDLRVGENGVRIRDVAHVDLRQPRLEIGRHLDRNFAIGIDVFKEPTANTVDTVDGLMKRIREIERDPELEGITLLVWMNAADEIRDSIAGLRNAGIFGGILAVFVLYFFLRKVRTTAVVAVAIPFSLVVTCAALYLLGRELNVLCMLGLALGVGMMVDNAVVVIENVHRLEGQGVPPREAARRGSREVALAVLAATATTVIVWSWLFIEEPSALTVQAGAAALPICLAVACSLLISLTFIPLAAARFAPRREVQPGTLMTRLVPAYRALLRWTFRHRFLTLAALLGLAATAIVPITRIEKLDEPKTVMPFVVIVYEVHDPSTKEVLEGYVDQVEDWLESKKEELGFERIYSWFVEGDNNVGTHVYLPEDRASEEAVEELQRKLQPQLPKIAGVKLSIGERDWWRRGPRGRRMVNVSLHGEDAEYLDELARRVEERLRKLPDVVDVFGPSVRGSREVRVVVDSERARAVGVSPISVAHAVRFSFRGQRLRRFEGENGEVELVLGVPEEAMPGLASLTDLPLPRAEGGTVPLGTVAKIETTRTPPFIERVDRVTTSRVSVQFDEEAVENTDVAQDRVAEAMKNLDLPEGYAWSWGEWGRYREDTLETMLRGVLLSLLVVVLLMAALFESFTQPIAIVISLPLAFFGAFWALWLFGFILDPVAFFGVILLIGIVVNNGIVMVNHVNALRREGMERVAALVQGCGDRLRPVLMTAITTIFGLIPLATGTFAVARAPVASLATAVIGGLASSTLFTLIALPVWYTTVEDVGSVAARLLPRRIRAKPADGGATGLLTNPPD